jgi:hypothetical protein
MINETLRLAVRNDRANQLGDKETKPEAYQCESSFNPGGIPTTPSGSSAVRIVVEHLCALSHWKIVNC